MTTVFPTTCDFTLIKRNDAGVGYAYVFLYSLSQPVTTQTIMPGSSIKFNNHGRLASIGWLTSDTLTMLKSGLFQIDFSINYLLNGVTSAYQPIKNRQTSSNVQVELYVNNVAVGVAFGSEQNCNSGIGKITGSYNLKLLTNDTLKLVGKTNPFVIGPAGNLNEITATFVVTEIL